MCLSGGGGAKTPTLDPVCIRETPEKMIVWSLPPQMKNPRYGPVNTTRKRFEPGHDLFTLPVAHSMPRKYNCSYHRSHTDQLYFHLHLKPNRRAAKTRLIQNLM